MTSPGCDAEGEGVALVSALVSHRYPGLRLRYWAWHPDGRELYLDEVVPFAYTPTQFGGQRQWLNCLGCSRPVRVLYGGKRHGGYLHARPNTSSGLKLDEGIFR